MFSKIKNWFKNYWYYYKWGVIIAAAFIIIIAICVVQSSNQDKYDVSIIYTGPHMFEPDEKSNISSSFEQLMDKDYNGDGKKVVDIIDLTAYTDEQIEDAIGGSTEESVIVKYAPYTVDNVKQNFSQIVFSGDASICFLDQYWYDILLDAQALLPLENILGYRPEYLIDDYSVYLSDLDIYEFFSESIGKLPEDTIVCFRTMSTASAFTGKKQAEKMYEYSQKLLLEIFEFRMP